MGSLYYTDAADLLRAAGLVVVECDGWTTRARSSGGFASAPLGIQWHHTASQTSPENDTAWQCEGSDDAPIGNGTIMRDGSIWLVAAGASNTAGKGGPVQMSRGQVPQDSGNSTTWAWEVANNGVGEPWPQVQIDAYFAATLVMNERFGNQPDDVFTHAIGAGDGWTDRKIDPATAAAVQGPWRPRSVNSSGTWSLDDIRAELRRRASGEVPTPVPPDPQPGPEPEPPPSGGTDMAAIMPTLHKGDRSEYVERMQHLLAAAGYMNPTNAANYDGDWGDGTDAAKARFDNDHGLDPSPPTDCGAKSWESLLTGRKW
jgi:N-acetylmuramoyl-L-alanine amidase